MFLIGFILPSLPEKLKYLTFVVIVDIIMIGFVVDIIIVIATIFSFQSSSVYHKKRG